MPGSLEELRNRIDEVDRQLARLLEERLRLCREIGEAKARQGAPLRDPAREDEVLSRVPPRLRRIFRVIIDECIDVQRSVVRG